MKLKLVEEGKKTLSPLSRVFIIDARAINMSPASRGVNLVRRGSSKADGDIWLVFLRIAIYWGIYYMIAI